MRPHIGRMPTVSPLDPLAASGDPLLAAAALLRNSLRPMAAREGPLWDVIEGRAPMPPAARLLGWELVAVDPEAGTIEIAFEAAEQFLNPAGDVQGGLLAAMLDDTLGPALVATLGPGEWAPTTDLHVQFLAPAKPGRLLGRGRVTKRGRSIAHMAGELLAADGTVLATAVATASLRSG